MSIESSSLASNAGRDCNNHQCPPRKVRTPSPASVPSLAICRLKTWHAAAQCTAQAHLEHASQALCSLRQATCLHFAHEALILALHFVIWWGCALRQRRVGLDRCCCWLLLCRGCCIAGLGVLRRWVPTRGSGWGCVASRRVAVT